MRRRTPTGRSVSSPAASSSGCSSRRRWRPAPGCCCWTSRWTASTCPTRARSRRLVEQHLPPGRRRGDDGGARRQPDPRLPRPRRVHRRRAARPRARRPRSITSSTLTRLYGTPVEVLDDLRRSPRRRRPAGGAGVPQRSTRARARRRRARVTMHATAAHRTLDRAPADVEPGRGPASGPRVPVHGQRVPGRHDRRRRGRAWSAGSWCCAGRASPATRSPSSAFPAPPARCWSASARPYGLLRVRRGRRAGHRARAGGRWPLVQRGVGGDRDRPGVRAGVRLPVRHPVRRFRQRRELAALRQLPRHQPPARWCCSLVVATVTLAGAGRDRAAAAVRVRRPRRGRRLAASRCVRLSVAFLVLLGVAAAEVSQITGTLLVFALLVVPAATAQALDRAARCSGRCSPSGSGSASSGPRCSSRTSRRTRSASSSRRWRSPSTCSRWGRAGCAGTGGAAAVCAGAGHDRTARGGDRPR